MKGVVVVVFQVRFNEAGSVRSRKHFWRKRNKGLRMPLQ